jgi:hypothetical protein
MMRSQSRQQRSASQSKGADNSAALRHSIAAAKENPFLSSRCAARRKRNARTISAIFNNDRNSIGCVIYFSFTVLAVVGNKISELLFHNAFVGADAGFVAGDQEGRSGISMTLLALWVIFRDAIVEPEYLLIHGSGTSDAVRTQRRFP